ncbi:hypothetical protein RCG23_23090 [Neobacillus sp. PS3-34]|uniref:hypothetical protein n=1 Tax=Neobacillus sp. PS3-34 TaxID=3070678 RepID=UPI0027DF1A15|nr:hypothetical protein [Neobacillus sp. PS3-34]WML48130.1 hypothetical protein RCG23_23090 [Neobacillus sp. PS3-34]
MIVRMVGLFRQDKLIITCDSPNARLFGQEKKEKTADSPNARLIQTGEEGNAC